MKPYYLLPIAFGLVAASCLFDLARLPAQGMAWTSLTVFMILAGAGLASASIALNWPTYSELPRDLGRIWMRREFGFIVLAEIALLYSLASRTGNAQFTALPGLLSCLGLLALALAVMCRLARQQVLKRQAALAEKE